MAMFEIPLRGAGGEPVDLWRTLNSHGVTELPPMSLDERARTLEITVPVPGSKPRTVRISAGSAGDAMVEVLGRAPAARALTALEEVVRHVLAFDRNLAGFYAMAAHDPDLTWVGSGAGRMLQSPTVFEEVVKTLCTTNCSWALTTKMVTALVAHLGEPAPGAPGEGWRGRAFPRPEAMAAAPERFYREIVRAGYRAPHFRTLAKGVAAGRIDLEGLQDPALTDDEVEERLLAVAGIGPYAAAHVMQMIGRNSRLILDSWTRPRFAKLIGRSKPPPDDAIVRRFRPYGEHAGLAFWCFLTRDWVEG